MLYMLSFESHPPRRRPFTPSLYRYNEGLSPGRNIWP
jgi:hypothetical protein